MLNKNDESVILKSATNKNPWLKTFSVNNFNLGWIFIVTENFKKLDFDRLKLCISQIINIWDDFMKINHD